MKPLKISWYSSNKIEIHDPADIQFAAPALLLMNLYTPLFVYNSNSEIDLGLIEKYSWISEQELKLTMKQGLKSSQGFEITAEDAYLSFKRLLVKQTNTHGDLQTFLCPHSKVLSMASECKGLSFKDNDLFLRIEDRNLAPFLIPLLTNIDFGIVPKNSINWNSPHLEISDYSNTSGPYFLSSTDIENRHILKSNTMSPLYSPEMPQEVVISPQLDETSPTKLRNKEIDMISTIDRADKDQLLTFAKDNNFNVHRTLDLMVTCLEYTQKGTKRFSRFERHSIGNLIKDRILKSLPSSSIYKPANQFFPPFGEASLTENEISRIDNQFHALSIPSDKKIKISVESNRLEYYRNLFKDIPKIEFIQFSGLPFTKKEADMEDASIIPTDSGFFENISLLSYYLSTGSFGFFDSSSGKEWLGNYIRIPEKNLRLQRLKDLHYNSLYEAYLFPLLISPFIAVVNSEWNLNFYKHFAGTPLWMMRQN